MERCSLCFGNAAGFNIHPVQISDKVSICNDCYDKLPDYTIRDKFQSIEALDSTWKRVMDYLISNQASGEVLEGFNVHFARRKYNYAKKYEIHLTKEELDKLERYLNKNVYSNLEEAMKNHVVSTTPSLQGYSIDEYLGFVSADVVLGTGFFTGIGIGLSDIFGVESKEYAEKLSLAKKEVLLKLIDKSIALGGNAIVGVKQDVEMLLGSVLAVSISGTSVIISSSEERVN